MRKNIRSLLRPGAALVTVASLLTAFGPWSSATGSTTVASAAGNRYLEQKLSWGTCTFTARVPVQCAMMTVPRDWAAPDAGPDLQVYVSRVAATGSDAAYQGVILTNPGGPGGQGASLPPILAKLQPTVNAEFDVLGMDPRGTGQSGAVGQAGVGITCQVPADRLPQGPLDARDRSRESIAAHQQTPKAVAEACQSVAEAPYITTWQTAHDMDLYRELLGVPVLNYIGYSYGTWLGAKYASLFPASTGRFVLDSSVDFQGRLQADFEDFPRMGQRHADRVFLPWVTRVAPEVFGTTVAEAKRTIEEGRATVIDRGGSPDDYDALLAGNGSKITWFLVLLTLANINGDGTGAEQLTKLPAELRADLERISRQHFGMAAKELTPAALIKSHFGVAATDYEQLPITRYAVACGDQVTKSTQWYKALSDLQGPKSPYLGWQYGLGEECGPWSDPPRETLPTLPRSVRDKIMVVQGEFDPQTSYEEAMSAVRKAPGVDVLRVDDAPFHGQYSLEGNPCVDGVVNTYLLHGAKSENSLCASPPLPGEDKVYPIHGPVDEYLRSHGGGHRGLLPRPLDNTVRNLLSELIGRANLHR